MFRLFIFFVLILGCSRELGVLQKSQTDSEVKLFEPSEMQRFRKLHAAFLKGIKENTLFNPAGLIPGIIRGGKIFRLIPNKQVIDMAILRSKNPWESDILQDVLKTSPLEKDVQGELIGTPIFFFYAAKHHLLSNALGFFNRHSAPRNIYFF